MKYLVTGERGFIGKAILSKIDGAALDTEQYDGVFHCGGKSSIPESFKNPEEFHHINVDGSKEIIAAAEKRGAKIVFSSSVSVYGPKSREVDEYASLDPQSPYAKDKVEVEHLLTKTKIPSIILRYSNVYGPDQKPSSGIVANFIDKALKGEDVTIFGDGEQLCDFVYVEDVADANIQAMKFEIKSCEIFNISSGVLTSVNTLANKIITLIQSSSKIVHVDGRVSDTTYPSIDINKAKKVLRWEPKVSLEEGLKKTIDFCQGIQVMNKMLLIGSCRYQKLFKDQGSQFFPPRINGTREMLFFLRNVRTFTDFTYPHLNALFGDCLKDIVRTDFESFMHNRDSILAGLHTLVLEIGTRKVCYDGERPLDFGHVAKEGLPFPLIYLTEAEIRADLSAIRSIAEQEFGIRRIVVITHLSLPLRGTGALLHDREELVQTLVKAGTDLNMEVINMIEAFPGCILEDILPDGYHYSEEAEAIAQSFLLHRIFLDPLT